MRHLVDTLVARLLLVSLLGITLVHVASLWTFEHALNYELSSTQDEGLAQRLLSIRRSVIAVPGDQRERLAHDLSGGAIEAHWTQAKAAVAGGPGAEMWASLAARLRETAPDLGPADVVVGTTSDPHAALLSLRLPDDTWLNVNLFASGRAKANGHGTVLSTTLMAAGVALLALAVAAWLTRPLRRMAEAVTTLAPDDASAAVPETGPREVRQLAAAFNGMRRRVAEMVTRRTQSLAAVSHDLRTPLTRLKLRIADVPDADLQRAMLADIDDMQQMIEATLSYLKGGETDEPMRPVDLVAMLGTIVDGARDGGARATLAAPPHVVVNARLVGLRRAFANLVGNALRFGSEVAVCVSVAERRVAVSITDDGPGIPDDKRAVVTEPFVRLESSRNAETGGVGLGLTIAKTSIEASGGTLTLRNRPQGGLEAIVALPLARHA